jgi:nucleolar GTP-binding protein
MNFQNLTKVEKYQHYLDVAFKNGRQITAKYRGQKHESMLVKSRVIESERLKTVRNTLYNSLDNITSSFPRTEQMTDFYQEMIKTTLDFNNLKKSLGAVNWAKNKIESLHTLYTRKIQKCMDVKLVNKIRNEFFGRVSSVMKQIKDELAYLENSRRTMRNFPNIKELPTVAIFGFPNVGKSTLLKKLTKASPEIASYSFTTKTLNLGYMQMGRKKIQFIDTPGTLDRLERMNYIEKQAYIVLKYCTNLIVYIFDLTEPYPVEQQEELFKKLDEFKKPFLIYVSKTDILDKEIIEEFKRKHKNIITDMDELKKEITRLI